MKGKEIIKFDSVSKTYNMGDKIYKALDNATFSIKEGGLVVILGPSGAGKSTLLNLLGGLDSPTSGIIEVDSVDISKLSENALAEYRASKVGFVFQFYNLIPTLTVYENVSLVKEISKNALDPKEMLEAVGLLAHMKKFPTKLSGGEQQRVSIARAICKNPKILLADEPTGALDSENGKMVLKLFLDLARSYNKTIIIVTHNQNIAKLANTIIYVKSGKIEKIVEQENPDKIDMVEF